MLRMAMTGIKAAIAAAWNGSLYMDSKTPFLGHIISDSEGRKRDPQPDIWSACAHSPISRFIVQNGASAQLPCNRPYIRYPAIHLKTQRVIVKLVQPGMM